MKYNPDKYHRRSLRLPSYDYTQAGAYFVTVCTHNRRCTFGNVIDGEMHLNRYGQAAHKCWKALPDHFANVQLDEFIVMPNHVHRIVHIVGCRGTACRAPTAGTGQTSSVERHIPSVEQFGHPVPGSLPTIIRSSKSATTKHINGIRGTPGQPLWQRNYYEHIIRDERELDDIRQYIVDNPAKWHEDVENPQNFPV
jgi:REP element-mobilizing transposase RayT